jgi:hypothetical protein
VKKIKCEDNNACDFLRERLQSPNKKGLCEARLINVKTGKHTRSLFFYKSSTADKGVVLNFCPFCGFQFTYEVKK